MSAYVHNQCTTCQPDSDKNMAADFFGHLVQKHKGRKSKEVEFRISEDYLTFDGQVQHTAKGWGMQDTSALEPASQIPKEKEEIEERKNTNEESKKEESTEEK